jgi:two-component system response regulator
VVLSLLLVEDSLDDEALSLRAITSSGVDCEVSVYRHGGDAVKALIAADGPVPNLIVLDFHLPGFNGLEILRELRKQERTRYVPVVMLSSLASDEEVINCFREGANSCVKKPIDPKIYVDHVASIVRYWLTVERQPEQ